MSNYWKCNGVASKWVITTNQNNKLTHENTRPI